MAKGCLLIVQVGGKGGQTRLGVVYTSGKMDPPLSHPPLKSGNVSSVPEFAPNFPMVTPYVVVTCCCCENDYHAAQNLKSCGSVIRGSCPHKEQRSRERSHAIYPAKLILAESYSQDSTCSEQSSHERDFKSTELERSDLGVESSRSHSEKAAKRGICK